MYNSSDSKDLKETFAFDSYTRITGKSTQNPTMTRVQDILEVKGKKGFIEDYVASQALLVQQSRNEQLQNNHLDENHSVEMKNSDSENESLVLSHIAAAKPMLAKKPKSNGKNQISRRQESKVTKKVCQSFIKRLSLFRAKGSLRSVPGLFSSSKQSKIVHIGNHDIFIDSAPKSLEEEMDQENAFFHLRSREDLPQAQPHIHGNGHEKRSRENFERNENVQLESEASVDAEEEQFPFQVDYYWKTIASGDQVDFLEYLEPTAMDKVEVEVNSPPRMAFFSPFTLQLY